MQYVLDSDIEEICNRLREHRHLIDGKSFLICGGDGFLGKYFQAVLSKLGHMSDVQITSIDNHESEFRLPGVKYIKHDITLPFKDDIRYDYILAGASIASPKVYKQYPIECMDVGYLGLKNCLERAKRDDAKLLFFSSSEVYGTATQIPTPETYVGAIPSDNERSCYDLSKIIGSSMVHYYVQKHDVDASIVLPFNFYGPMKNDGRVIPSFIHKIVNGQPVEIYNGGNQQRCYTYITDGIVGCLKVLLTGGKGQKYNIGNPDTEVSVSELANVIEKVIEQPINKNVIDYPATYAGAGDPTRRVPDITKASNDLGFKPEVSLEEGIRRFYDWASKNYKD
jgi:UDP-glucuronate decarboxylase